MAGDVQLWARWLLRAAAPAAAAGQDWRVVLPFCLVGLVLTIWLWLPKLLVGLLNRVSRRYVKHSSSGPSDFVVRPDGESKVRQGGQPQQAAPCVLLSGFGCGM